MSKIPLALTETIDHLIPPSARELHHTLKQAGHPTYIVGGWIRNIIIAWENHGKFLTTQSGDIDFTTAAEPEQVIALFPHTHPTGIKHGTVTVMMGKDAYEVTTFRQEGKYTDNRRPESVSFSKNLEEDLIRRDFTVNAFAYEPESRDFIDLFNGIADLHDRMLRVICKPPEPPIARFQEDALRMMRACRLAAQFDFTIEPETLEAISIAAPLIEAISKERIRDEIIKTVSSSEAAVGMEYLRTSGIMGLVLPELFQTVGVEQNRFHAYDVYTHSVEVMKALNRLQREKGRVDYRLSLVGLFHDLAKPLTKAVDKERIIDGEPHTTFYRHEILGAVMTEKILKRLRFPLKDITLITHLVRHHMFYYTPEWKDGTVRRFVSRIGRENLDYLFLLRQADRLGKGEVPPEYREDNQDLQALQSRIQALITEKSFLTLADLKVNGKILIQELSLTPGPLLGYVLKQLLEIVLDDPEKNRRDILIEEARKLILSPSPPNESQDF